MGRYSCSARQRRFFLHCANDIHSVSFILSIGVRVFNFFHPLDPVAYRMEPLLASELREVPLEQVPRHLKTQSDLQTFWRWASGQEEEDVRSTLGAASHLQLNAGRVDWVLQQDLTIIGMAVELMQALPSHACYFPSKDVASFVFVQSSARATSFSNRCSPLVAADKIRAAATVLQSSVFKSRQKVKRSKSSRAWCRRSAI